MYTIKWKVALVVLVLFTQLIFSSLVSAQVNNILDGMWRGELIVQKRMKIAIGIEVSNDNAKLTLNSPNQGMYDRVPSSFAISGNNLTFKDEGLGAVFEGKIIGDKVVGTFTQGKAMSLTLHKLEESDLDRMKFEGKYGGELKINANSSLPLVLHIAVIKNGYSAALDSQAQNSLGIPIDEIDVNDKHLKFTSTLISAKFSGKHDGAGYSGSFIQGMPLALTLTKISNEQANNVFKKAKFGAEGGAVALIEKGKVSTKFLGDHNLSTQYEIGSITKTFTAYLLAQQVTENKIQLASTVNELFSGAHAIKLQDLATHTSGLARNPPSLTRSSNAANPFSHITRDDLQNDLNLANTILGRKEYLYSNFGFSVLGEALAINAKTTLSVELEKRIFEPLLMENSYLADIPRVSHGKLAQGHNSMGAEVDAWNLAAVSGAGAIVSTLGDMVKYAKHMMQESKTNSAMANLLFTSYSKARACCNSGLAWILMKDKSGNDYAWHNGMTGGFSSFIGFYLDGSRGLIMLNSQAAGFDKTAHAILTGETLIQNI